MIVCASAVRRAWSSAENRRFDAVEQRVKLGELEREGGRLGPHDAIVERRSR